jgi:hypothetical protein
MAMGKGGDAKALVSSVPLSDDASVEVERLLVGKTVTVTVRGVPIKFEVGPGANAKGLAQVSHLVDQARGPARSEVQLAAA